MSSLGSTGAGARARALQCAFRLRAAAGGGGGGGGGGGAKKKSRGGPQTPQGPTVPVEIRAKATLGANIHKEGSDPAIKEDSEYPAWLWDVGTKLAALSELQRKDVKTLPMFDLKRLVKLDNRRRIKERNSLKAKS